MAEAYPPHWPARRRTTAHERQRADCGAKTRLAVSPDFKGQVFSLAGYLGHDRLNGVAQTRRSPPHKKMCRFSRQIRSGSPYYSNMFTGP